MHIKIRSWSIWQEAEWKLKIADYSVIWLAMSGIEPVIPGRIMPAIMRLTEHCIGTRRPGGMLTWRTSHSSIDPNHILKSRLALSRRLSVIRRYSQAPLCFWTEDIAILPFAGQPVRPAVWVMNNPLLPEEDLASLMPGRPHICRKSTTFPYLEWPVWKLGWDADKAGGDQGEHGPLRPKWALEHLRGPRRAI